MLTCSYHSIPQPNTHRISPLTPDPNRELPKWPRINYSLHDCISRSPRFCISREWRSPRLDLGTTTAHLLLCTSLGLSGPRRILSSKKRGFGGSIDKNSKLLEIKGKVNCKINLGFISWLPSQDTRVAIKRPRQLMDATKGGIPNMPSQLLTH